MSNKTSGDYIGKWIADCDRAKVISDRCCPDFVIDDFSNIKKFDQYDDINNILGINIINKEMNFSKLSKIKKAIYIIKEVGGNVQQTWDDFSQYRDTQKMLSSGARKCSKLNQKPSKAKGIRTIYVGSVTRTSLRNRMKQHIGDGSKSTYALNLKHWFNGNNRKCKIEVYVYDDDDTVSPRVLKIMESARANKLQPVFGRHAYQNLP